MFRSRVPASVFVVFLLSTSAASTDLVPRGDRRLAVVVTEAADGDYDAAFETALGAGMQATDISLGWDDIEVAPQVYDGTILDIVDVFYPAWDLPILLTISPTDTGLNRLPADLVGRAFDDALVVQRFRQLLDFVFSRIPRTELIYLAIGNEIDIAFGADPAAWSRWRTFLTQTAAHARSLRPGLDVGTKVTYDGLSGAFSSLVIASQDVTDTVQLTYYPIDEGFQVRDPSVVAAEVRLIMESFPGRRVALTEAGYPSSTSNGSSEELQRRFIEEIFLAWDDQADRLDLISFTWLTDLSQAQVDSLADYYGLDDPAFGEFLRTLGLRRQAGSGEDKPAFLELQRQAALRGWDSDVAGEVCQADETTLCLQGNRFRVEVSWETFEGETGRARVASAATPDSGILYFFDPDNWEILLKVLDGCALNDHFWVFAAATTNLGYELTITDTETFATRTYRNNLGDSAPAVTDAMAFATCPRDVGEID